MLEQRSAVDLLRFITCGSVDDGKSTLIGRLLWERGLLFEDHLAALEADSRRLGTQGEDLDFALLLDGLAAEREQGITIDVAYRHLNTVRRRFIVADTPGHEQYTRNMATGASTADAAVILVDARKGILRQTRRHSYIVAALGVRHVALAVNKMDLVGYEEARFAELEAEYRGIARSIGVEEITCIPVSALRGDNIVCLSEEMPWFTGPSLLEYLENVELDSERLAGAPFRFPVQWVNRPDQAFRGFAGTVVAGSVAPGDRVRLLPSGRETHVGRVVAFDGDLEQAAAGQAVTLTLADDVDASRGEVICSASTPAQIGDLFEATVIWMTEAPLLPGRSYLLRCGTQTSGCSVTVIRHRVEVDTGGESPTGRLALNEIGLCELRLDQPIAYDPYDDNRETGGFILIDRITNSTAGAGMFRRALADGRSIHWQESEVSKASRAALKGQRPCVVWLTGLSGAGKSTIANLVERRLNSRGYHTYVLDGANLRH